MLRWRNIYRAVVFVAVFAADSRLHAGNGMRPRTQFQPAWWRLFCSWVDGCDGWIDPCVWGWMPGAAHRATEGAIRVSLNDRLRSVMAAVFGIDASAVSDETSPETFGGWDSISHIQLIMALEAEFGIRFEPGEIPQLTSLKQIRDRLGASGH